MKFKKGDNVIVISGRDKGKHAKVLEVFKNRDRVLVDGINMKKKHQRARKSNEKGQMVSMASPLHASNVMLIDPKTNKQTRVGSKMVSGKKVRVTKKSGVEI